MELTLAALCCFGGLATKAIPPALLLLNALLLVGQLARLILGQVNLPLGEQVLVGSSLGLILIGSGSGLTNAFDKAVGLESWGRLLAGFSLFLALWHWLRIQPEKTNARLHHLAGLLVLFGLELALTGLFAAQWNTKLYKLSLYENLPKLNLLGNINANLLAGALVVLLPLPFGLIVAAKGRAGKGLGLLAALILPGVLFLTQSRTAWLAGGGSLGFLLLLALLSRVTGKLEERTRRRITGLTLLSLPLFTGLALLNFIPPERAAVWRLDCRLVEQFPLTGMGFGNFARGGPLFFPYFLDTSGSAHDALYAAYSGHVFNNHAHNLFFQVWLDLGIIGLFGFSLWLGWLIWQSWCFLLNTRFVVQTAIAYAFVAGATAFLLQSLSDASLWTARSGFTNWPLLAGLTALPNLYPKTVGAYCIRPPLNIHTYRIRPRWAIPITGLALLTLLTLNWNNLANLTERNLGNLALQATLLNASPELQTEPYRDKSSVFLAKFYALPMAILDKAQLEQAASHYRQAVEANPSDAASWRYLGIAEALEENIETARQHLAQALKVAPQDRYSAFAAGLIAYQKEDYAEAIVYWQQSRNGELFPLAHGIMEKLEPEKQSAATRDFELSLAVRPTALTHLYLAELSQRQHLWESAINHYREAIRLEPSDYYNYQQLGNLYLELRRKAEAAPVLWQALALNPGNRNLLELLEKAKT